MFSAFEVNEERLYQLYFNEFFLSLCQRIGGFQNYLDIAIGALFLLLESVFDFVD